jgi:hypothetical protein
MVHKYLIVEVVDVAQSGWDSGCAVDIACSAPKCKQKTYKWLRNNGKYTCSFSGHHDCYSCITTKNYEVSEP